MKYVNGSVRKMAIVKRLTIPEKSFIFLCRNTLKEMFLGPEQEDRNLEFLIQLFDQVKFDISQKEKKLIEIELQGYSYLNISRKKLDCIRKILKILKMKESLSSFSIPVSAGVA